MREIEVTFHDEKMNFKIRTNVPDNLIDACIINWEARNMKNLTAESLIEYINSKREMTGHTAKGLTDD